jgi:phosphatidylserine/phosphatidylglycerophosphate/cardiolipin synthase-like enzyme
MSKRSPFPKLSLPMLSGLSQALEMGLLQPPFQIISVSRYVSERWVDAVTQEMNLLNGQGMTVGHLAYLLKMMLAERQAAQVQQDQVDLVWSGLETSGTESRDTQVVVQELFGQAEHSVLIATYAIDQQQKAEALFSKLAQKLDRSPDFQVRLFLNVHRPSDKSAKESEVLRAFCTDFQEKIWPGERLPEVFYDPRSLSPGFGPRACLHAKCIVIDDASLFVTSANFTEAAQKRNLEAGILLHDVGLARSVIKQFEGLAKAGQLKPLFGH